jgi:electron transfer flavoprotein beta subunit
MLMLNILVCVKRVPDTGARIVLTADEQAVETRNLGFTISPHEECALEEAIRLVEKAGGRTTVLTLGPEAATEQLRAALALGADEAVLLETDGREWDPAATAGAIVTAVRRLESEHGVFDLLFFGNEAADTGDYQVGIRVAHTLDRPCVAGIKGLEMGPDGTAVARREAGNGWDLFEVSLPAVFTIKEGINVPRYPTLRGRMAAKRKEIAGFAPEWREGALVKSRLRTIQEQAGQVEILGHGPEAAPRVVALLKELGVVR